MKDAIDMVLDVRSLINVPAVTSIINGKVHANIRPDGSEKADVLVTAIGIDDDADQQGSGNIRIYVPKVLQSGISVTDQTRLHELGKIIHDLVNEKYMSSFRVWVSSKPRILRDTDGTNLLHMGYTYHSIQDN